MLSYYDLIRLADEYQHELRRQADADRLACRARPSGPALGAILARGLRSLATRLDGGSSLGLPERRPAGAR